MARPILSEYGPERGQGSNRATNGGDCCPPKELPYDPPKGPTTFNHEGPGLAGHTNHGNAGTQGKH